MNYFSQCCSINGVGEDVVDSHSARNRRRAQQQRQLTDNRTRTCEQHANQCTTQTHTHTLQQAVSNVPCTPSNAC